MFPDSHLKGAAQHTAAGRTQPATICMVSSSTVGWGEERTPTYRALGTA